MQTGKIPFLSLAATQAAWYNDSANAEFKPANAVLPLLAWRIKPAAMA
ncbi:MAG: hypothetical protein K2J60_07140 [Acetatifactor sp.]|nr:hypothetical protein [Acetatifactor sp.]